MFVAGSAAFVTYLPMRGSTWSSDDCRHTCRPGGRDGSARGTTATCPTAAFWCAWTFSRPRWSDRVAVEVAVVVARSRRGEHFGVNAIAGSHLVAWRQSLLGSRADAGDAVGPRAVPPDAFLLP